MSKPELSPPAVSVVLPAKDAELSVRRALVSMLDQSMPDLELIVVDDGSADRTKEIALALAGSDPRVRVLDAKPPGGLVAALQTGTDAAGGRLIARMDADDFSYPDRFEQQVAFLESHPDFAACGCRVRVPDALGDGIRRYVDWSNSLIETRDLERERFIESPLVHPSVMMRTGALRRVGGYRDPGWPEDYDLWLRMFDAGMKIGKLAGELLDWHDRPGRLTRADPRYAEDQFLRAKAHFLSRLPEGRSRGFALCGAGPIGKRLGRFLREEGATVHVYYDVHPRRIGESINGVPVCHHTTLSPHGKGGQLTPLLISAVGQPATRERVRSQLNGLGYREGTHFFAAS